jgi:cation diffusion facilitator CzcD-associated flavoprotein CzcO
MFEVRPKPGLVGIVGAGRAGLAAAQATHATQARGVPYVLWEAGSGLGGNSR